MREPAERRATGDLIDDCVHCGFCLPACPTYQLWGEEMDSPRGRIQLMRQLHEGEPLGPSMVEHFDACLGCMACVPACPSGVRYDVLIERTRADVERGLRRPLAQRLVRGLVFAVFVHPRRLRVLRRLLRGFQRTRLAAAVRSPLLLRVLPRRLATAAQLTPTLGPIIPVPEHTAGAAPTRGRVGLVTGCVQAALFPEVNAATARVLAAEGYDVEAPSDQGCCGALSIHNGRDAEAKRFARALLTRFRDLDVDAVVVNAAGCGSVLKDYGALLADADADVSAAAREFAAKVRDVAEFLAAAGPVTARHPLPLVVAYHDACHLANAQGVRAQPRRLLAAIPGVEVREIPDSATCCGSAGIYNLLNPAAAAELGDRKAAAIAGTGATVLVTANPGCALHITAALRRLGVDLPVVHTVEVLDVAIRGAGLPAAD
jgi:glycolate oxidase iron-sulfur subunit